jgi:hypothetical protein
MIKLTSKPTLVKVVFSKLFSLLGILAWGVGSIPPNVITKLKRDENLVGLIRASKVSYAKGLKNVWDNYNWSRSSSKKKHKN